MLNISLTKDKFWDNSVEGYVIFLHKDFKLRDNNIEKTYPHIEAILKKHSFKGNLGDSFVLTSVKKEKLINFVFVGLGEEKESWQSNLENLRRAIGTTVLKIKKLEIESAVINLPENKIFGVESCDLIKHIAIAAIMSSYEFKKFKTEKKDKEWTCDLFLACEQDSCGPDTCKCHTHECENSLSKAKVIGDFVNKARLLCDMPPNIATPTYVSEEAKKLSSNILGLKCAIFGKEKAKELGMGGFLSVDAGSEQEGKFVVLEYNCGDKNAPKIALVGKGVTFDSGGISLKPSGSMTGMKFDMSGAAAVISSMAILGNLKPKINVVGLAPLVENMPSGRAGKQDDIITFMNGKTAEIVNTDAEGRLIVADALCYAEKFYSPDVIIDIATLTGACLYALGHSFTALMTKDTKLSGLLQNSGDLTGDRVWELPLDNDFKDAIKSRVADISNCGSSAYKAGTITAGIFLSNFVSKAKWAHLDIAGTADSVPGISYLGKGSTGAGVRLLVDFVMNYK